MKQHVLALCVVLSGVAGAQATATQSEDHAYMAQELANEASRAYSSSFYDQGLWKAAISEAQIAAQSGEHKHVALLAQMYMQTQWWVKAYQSWQSIADLSAQEKVWAGVSAAKMAYLRYAAKDYSTARTYLNQGLQWDASNESLKMLSVKLK